MGNLLNIVTPLHRKTARDYLARMNDDKVACMQRANQFEFDYWDGDRRFGYGGYKYDGRWKIVAEALIQRYKLGPGAKVLDIGCGKGHLLFELHKLLPGAVLAGIDISRHGISGAPDEIRPVLTIHRAQDPLPYPSKSFDLIISLATLHNLRVSELASALPEIERVGKAGFVMVESYRNEQELFNLQCWALTCRAFFDDEEWIWLFEHFGYRGDYEFIYME